MKTEDYKKYEQNVNEACKDEPTFYLNFAIQLTASMGCQAFERHPKSAEEAIKEATTNFFSKDAIESIIKICKALSVDERGFLIYISKMPKEFFKLY